MEARWKSAAGYLLLQSFGLAVLVGYGGTTAEAIKDTAIPPLRKY
jgi:hypothetical protein